MIYLVLFENPIALIFTMSTLIPTSLYIHMPWCIKKCPYCDFNSHKAPQQLPEAAYIDALVEDFKQDIKAHGMREISSIFIGGGTPSLFSGASYEQLLHRLQDLSPFQKGMEITLEANPGAVEQARFEAYRQIGINRLSIGVQSFHDASLHKIGRIHGAAEAQRAIHMAQEVGFENINIDIMYGLPNQTIALGLADLEIAFSRSITHLSWYQFTLEPNTYFYKFPPPLPQEDALFALEETGHQMLRDAGFHRYEISAFGQAHRFSQHNLNYWTFGDYFGIGAGAHGKLTCLDSKKVSRTQKHRLPHTYLDPHLPYLVETKVLTAPDLIFEFMLNTTRLAHPIPMGLFTERTNLCISNLLPQLEAAKKAGFIHYDDEHWEVTRLGQRYTNNLQSLFL